MKTRCALLAVAALGCAVLGFRGAPTPVKAEPVRPASARLSDTIDGEILKVLERDGLKPAPIATDEAFVRRVYLDVVGVPPTREEARAFIDDDTPGKRARLIDGLLDDSRFGEHMADLWMSILRERGNDLENLGASAGDVLAVWLAYQFNSDRAFDAIVRDIVTAEGAISDNPPAAYYGLMGFPARVANMAGLTTKHFAGMQIQCAECHDHHYEPEWTQENFVGMASFFTGIEINADFYVQPIDPRVETKPLPPRAYLEKYVEENDVPSEFRGRIDDVLTYDRPRLLGDKAVKTRDTTAWRRMMAAWLTDKRNDTAMRYQVNRFWSFLFGIGLLNPVDDFNSLNEPSHPELLAHLGGWWARQGFSVKKLYRAILNSRTWQRGGQAVEGAERWHFANAPVRQLTPEQFFAALFNLRDGDAILKPFARKTQSAYDELDAFRMIREMQRENGEEPEGDIKFDRGLLAKYREHLENMRPEWQIRRGLARRYSALAQNDEMTMSETFTLSITQALEILNGDVTRRLSDSRNGSLIYGIMRDFESTGARVEALFLSILCRRPTVTERRRALEYLEELNKEGTGEQPGLEDLFYALVSTTEFATNH